MFTGRTLNLSQQQLGVLEEDLGTRLQTLHHLQIGNELSTKLLHGHPISDCEHDRLDCLAASADRILGADTVNDPNTSAGKERFFSGRDERRVLDGVGHFPSAKWQRG